MKGELIGAFVNAWRGRHVQIFEDSDDPAMVYTEGRPLVNHTCHIPGQRQQDCQACKPQTAIETHEARALYNRYLGSYSKVYR